MSKYTNRIAANGRIQLNRLSFLLALGALASLPTVAKDNDANFADAVLLKQVWVDDGMSCSSHGSGKVDDDGNISTHSSGGCSQNRIAHYTVECGTTVYVLQPKLKHPKTAFLTLGYSAMFARQSVLHSVPLGTHVGMRIDKHGDAIVKVAEGREAPYRIVEAEPTADSSAKVRPAPRPTPRVCLETATDSQGNLTCLRWDDQR
jgi:hypothetical protein